MLDSSPDKGLMLVLVSFLKDDPDSGKTFVYEGEFPSDDLLLMCADKAIGIWFENKKKADFDNNIYNEKLHNKDVQVSMVGDMFVEYKRYALENWSGEAGEKERQFQFASHAVALHATIPPVAGEV
jgi:hypothetical protein